MRHEWLSRPEYATTAHARTVLVTHVKEDMMTESAMRELASPGQVEKVWLIRDTSDVDEVYEERNKACSELEASVGKVLGLAAKRIRKGKAPAPESGKVDPESGDSALLNSIIREKKRPKHSLTKIPLCGPKADSLDWCVETIKKDNDKLDELRAKEGDYKLATSAILRFATQAQAVEFAQNLPKEKSKLVGPRYVDFEPDTIVWDNLGVNAKLLPPKKAVSWGLTIGLILIWSVARFFFSCGHGPQSYFSTGPSLSLSAVLSPTCLPCARASHGSPGSASCRPQSLVLFKVLRPQVRFQDHFPQRGRIVDFVAQLRWPSSSCCSPLFCANSALSKASL